MHTIPSPAPTHPRHTLGLETPITESKSGIFGATFCRIAPQRTKPLLLPEERPRTDKALKIILDILLFTAGVAAMFAISSLVNHVTA